MKNILRSNSAKSKRLKGSMHFKHKVQFVLYDGKKENVYLDKQTKGRERVIDMLLLTEGK